MHVAVARLLARAESIPTSMQLALWHTGDDTVRYNLVALPTLAVEVEELMLQEGDARLVASWARACRSSVSIERALSLAADEVTLMALASSPSELSPLAAEELVSKATAATAARLLRRDDLTTSQRADLVHAYLGGIEPVTSSVGRVLAETLGADPLIWEQIAKHCLPNHHGFLSSFPASALRDVRVQRALLSSLDNHPAPFEASLTNSSYQRAIKSLVAAPTLSLDDASRLEGIVARYYPALAQLARQRAEVDIANLVIGIKCFPDKECPTSSADHVADVEALANAVHYAELPLNQVFFATLAHREQIPDAALEGVAIQLRGDSGRDALCELERRCGAESDHLRDAVRAVGVWPALALENPVPAFAALARTGWPPLERSMLLPDSLVAAVTLSHVPLTALLGDNKYAAAALDSISSLSAREQDTALGLLGEWSLSLEDLIAAVKIIAETGQPAG